MTDDELNRLQALADAATAGPWRSYRGAFMHHSHIMARDHDGGGWIDVSDDAIRDEDAAFIAASRDAIPTLIAEVKRLRAAQAGEIAGFDAGFNAQRAGVEYDAPGVEQPYDVWRCGWAWGAFDGLNADVRRLRWQAAERRSLLAECLLHDMRHLPSCSYVHDKAVVCDCGLYTLVGKIDRIIRERRR